LHWAVDLCPLHIGLHGYLRKQALASSVSQLRGRPAGNSSVGLKQDKTQDIGHTHPNIHITTTKLPLHTIQLDMPCMQIM